MKNGDEITFIYKDSKFVEGKIYNIVRQILWLILYKDYVGKNEEWDAGDIKPFNIKEMSNIKLKNMETKEAKTRFLINPIRHPACDDCEEPDCEGCVWSGNYHPEPDEKE